MGKVVRRAQHGEAKAEKIPAIGGPGDPGFLAIHGRVDGFDIPVELPCGDGVYHLVAGTYVWRST